MSRVSNDYSTTGYTNGLGQGTTSLLSRSSSTASSPNNNVNSTRGVIVRSAAPPPVQKETVHACPLCNGEYKDPRVLPCTHTFCLNCIRDKLINNNRVTCPKCQYQVDQFGETDLYDLPPNRILSQEWHLATRSIPPAPTSKKPVTYQSANSTTQMSKQTDKRKSSVSKNSGLDTPTNDQNFREFSQAVSGFQKMTGGFTQSTASRSSRSSSVASTQPGVLDLVRIYSEATGSKQIQKPRSESIVSTGKHEELTRIFEQATNRSQRSQSSTSSRTKQPTHAREENYEEITWDTLKTPVAPPLPNQLGQAKATLHEPSGQTERPISAASSHRSLNINNLAHIVASANPHFDRKSSSFIDRQTPSRSSTISNEINDSDEDGDQQTPVQQPIYAIISPKHVRQDSFDNSVRSNASSTRIRRSPVPNNQQRTSISPAQLKQEDKYSIHSGSVGTSSRRSSDRFPPPPPPNIEPFDFVNIDQTIIPRSPAISNRSSIYNEINDEIPSKVINQTSPSQRNSETNLSSTARFETFAKLLPTLANTNSSRDSSVSTNSKRLGSGSVDRDSHYLVPVQSSTLPTNVKSRVDSLLTDQKRLEREIDEQIKRLKSDYDDVRKQINDKQLSIYNQVKTMATRLDDDLTEDYHRKQQIFADLAADTDSLGNELERLKSSSNNNNDKQQLWDNLEKIENNIRKIRQVVEQQKKSSPQLKFTAGQRSITPNTIGQISHRQNDSQPRLNSSSSFQRERIPANITPYKYVKIDHFSTLEPEAIAITENHKKILLGICNKLFILNEQGELLKEMQLKPSIRGIAISKMPQSKQIAYISHDETISMIDIDNGKLLDSVKETDSNDETGAFLPLGVDTDNIRGNVYVCDYRNSCVIKFDEKLEFIVQWKIYNNSNQYHEARPKLISVYGQKFYMIVEHSSQSNYNQGIAYSFSLHICDVNSGNIIKLIDADLLSTQRLRWPCAVQAINNDKCYILDTMTSGKYFNGYWQKHWSRILEIDQDDNKIVTELFQLDSEAEAMAMTKQLMIIAANGDIIFIDLNFHKQRSIESDHEYQNLQ